MRYAFKGAIRALRNARGFSVVSGLLLAVALTAFAVAFAVVRSVLLAPLPFPQPDQLVRIWETNPGRGITRSPVSRGNFFDWRNTLKSFDAIEAFANPRDTVVQFDRQRPEMVRQVPVSDGFFRMMRTRPLLGDIEKGASVLNHRFWSRRFIGDGAAVTHTYTIQGFPERPKAVSAVMPPQFDFPAHADQWTTLTFGSERSVRDLNVVARVRSGVSLESARAELDAFQAVLGTEHPKDNAGWRTEVVPLKDTIVAGTAPMLTALAIAVCTLLAIAVSSVSSMFVAHFARTRFEDTIRLALGGTRRHVLVQRATEVTLITTASFAIALAATSALLPTVSAASADLLPRYQEIAWDGTVAFALGSMWLCVTAVLLVPHLSGVRSLRVAVPHRPRGASARPIRLVLVAAQVGLCVLLLTVCSSVVSRFVARANSNLGFSPDAVTSAQVRLPIRVPTDSLAYYPSVRFVETANMLLERATQGAEGTSSAVAWHLPTATFEGRTTFAVLDSPRSGPVSPSPVPTQEMAPCAFNIVSTRYFETLRITLLAGRTFEAADRWTDLQLNRDAEPRGPGVAIVSYSFVRTRGWTPNEALHRYLFVDSASAPSVEIVGVVGDIRDAATGLTEPTVYLPFTQAPTPLFSFVTRSPIEEQDNSRHVEALLSGLGTDVWAFDTLPLRASVERELSLMKFGALVVSILGTVASVVAVAALIGLVTFLAAIRRWELAVRVALGAATKDLTHTLIKDGLVSATLGAAMGALASGLLSQSAGVVWPEALVISPLSIAFVSLGALVVSAGVLYIPAWRASRIDPVAILKAD